MSTGQDEPWQRAFFDRLSSLYEAAGIPTYESLAAHCKLNQQPVSISSLQEWITGKTVPRTANGFRVLIELLETLARRRQGANHRPASLSAWEAWRNEAERERRRRSRRTIIAQPDPRRRAAAHGSDAMAETNDAGDGQAVVIGEIPREPPAFVPRRALDRLAQAAEQGHVAVVCAMTGLRGVGKTQVAAAYARDRIGQGWGLVAWVNAESQDSMLADLARIADVLGVAVPEGDSLESARRLREYLGVRSSRGVIVFDNAADPDVLRPFLPATGTTQVVITSTERAFTELGVAVEVSTFGRGESLGYLARRTGLTDRIGATAVADALGDLPLGLAQAAATIVGQRLTYQKYLEKLSKIPVAELLGRVPGAEYPHATAAALLLNVRAAEASDPSMLANRLLRVVAAFSADGVRRSVLDGLAAASAAGAGPVDSAAEHCVAWSLMSWSVTGDAVIMHRLLSRVLRERDQVVDQWAGTVNMALELLEPLLFKEDEAWARRNEGAHLGAC